ncbi:MAG: hypothetical protein ACYC0F_06485 [Rhodanobacter sp.]
MTKTFTKNFAYRLVLAFGWAIISGLTHAQGVPAKDALSPNPTHATSAGTPARALTSPADNLEYYKTLVEAQAKVAESAIQSSQKSVDTIKDVIFLISLGAGLIGAVLGFLGLKEYRSIKSLRDEATKASDEAKKELAEMVVQKEEYKKWCRKADEELKTQFAFFSARFQFEIYSDVARTEDPTQTLVSTSKELRPRLITELEEIRQHTEVTAGTERMLSWVRATLGILYKDDGSYIRALDLGEESYNSNPQHFADRAYNCACFASRAYEVSKDPSMLQRCANWLACAIAQDTQCAVDALTDRDLSGVLELQPIKQLLIGVLEPEKAGSKTGETDRHDVHKTS